MPRTIEPQLFESVYGPGSASGWWYWTDALGSVRMRTSTSGSLLEAHDYYPFGQDMIGRSSAGAPVRQGFTGYWRDHEAGPNLYYAGARQYDPTTGRFFGVDPLAEDFPTWSGYTYTLNDPVRWRDPDGRCPVGSQAGDIHDGSVCMQEIVVTAERIRNDWIDSPWIYGASVIALIEPTPLGELLLGTAILGYMAYSIDKGVNIELANKVPEFRGGKQNQRDQGLRGYPENFKRWFHRHWKQRGDPQAKPIEIKEAFDEWVRLGQP